MAPAIAAPCKKTPCDPQTAPHTPETTPTGQPHHAKKHCNRLSPPSIGSRNQNGEKCGLGRQSSAGGAAPHSSFVHWARTRISYFTALTSTTYVVLSKVNHMQLTEAAILDRKSGVAEGSAVLRTLPGDVFDRSAAQWRACPGVPWGPRFRFGFSHTLYSLWAFVRPRIESTRSLPLDSLEE